MAILMHYFNSTAEAYDATMTDDGIKTGDVLIVQAEKVVGLADTWPVAVTVEAGEFHHVRDGLSLASYGFKPEHVRAAVSAAKNFDYPLINRRQL